MTPNDCTSVSAVTKKMEIVTPFTKKDYIFYKLVCKDEDVTSEYIKYTTLTIKKAMRYNKMNCEQKGSKHYDQPLEQYIRSTGGISNWDPVYIETRASINYTEARQIKRELIEKTPIFIEINQPVTSIEED